MSHFSFVSNKILRSNLDMAFAHIVDLLALSESDEYKGKTLLVSSLRKTIIIHTASIVEALLLWRLGEVCRAKKVELIDEWKYYEVNVLYSISDSSQVIAGKRNKEKKDLSKLDFIRITDLCYKYQIIKSEKLKQEINNVRELRNRLHIGSLSDMEKQYEKKDLEFCFSVAKMVKEL